MMLSHTDIFNCRKERLNESYSLQKFNFDLKELEQWVNNMQTRMTSGEIAKDIPEAEAMMELHQERKVGSLYEYLYPTLFTIL